MQSLLLSIRVLPLGIAVMFASLFGIIVVGVFTASNLFRKGVPNKVRKLIIGICVIAVLVLIMLASRDYWDIINPPGSENDFPKWLGYVLFAIDIIAVTMYFGLTTDKKE